jgi:hypothetical protein
MLDLNGNEIDERKSLALKYSGATNLVMRAIIDNPDFYKLPPEKVKGAIIEVVKRYDPTLGVFTIDRSVRKVWSMPAFKPPENIEQWRRKEQEKHTEMFKGD